MTRRMQGRTIDNALRQLHREAFNGRHEGMEHILALMELRDVKPAVTQRYPANAAKRGETMRFVLGELKAGPKTTKELARALMKKVPILAYQHAWQRVYMGCKRLEGLEAVGRDGRLWRLVR